jgi:hypothetical protein
MRRGGGERKADERNCRVRHSVRPANTARVAILEQATGEMEMAGIRAAAATNID